MNFFQRLYFRVYPIKLSWKNLVLDDFFRQAEDHHLKFWASCSIQLYLVINIILSLMYWNKLASVRGFGSLVKVESTYWGVVKLFNTQNKLMDVHQWDISKILPFSTSNLVSFIFIKSRHFTEAYLVLLHKTSHTSCILFSSGFHMPVAERVHLFLQGKIVRGITNTLPHWSYDHNWNIREVVFCTVCFFMVV